MELSPQILLPSYHLNSTLRILFRVMTVLLISSPIVASSIRNETDRLGLIAFREKITQDPLNIMSSWNDSVHFCYWPGVFCGKRHPERVTALELEGKKLAGTLPPHIGNLSFLSWISLAGNFFRGEVPQEMGCLFRLRYLNLSSNALQGEIPSSLLNCSNLQAIDLSYNNLVGEIPFLQTKNLLELHLSTNNLTGSIPIWLGNATSLVWLFLTYNNFWGTIPSKLGRLSNLEDLEIGTNNMSGIVPPQIYNLSSLIYLDIGHSHLYGRIPSEICSTLPNLLYLNMGGNYFSGSLPLSLSNASGLSSLNFAFNNFTGTVPLNLGSLKNLRRLALEMNYLENDDGQEFSFITSLTNCSKLEILDIQSNMFSGELPSSIANFSDALMVLSLATNQISGTIPAGIEALVGLQYFVISQNMITGKIPLGIGKLERLKYIYMFTNRISGAIPSSLGNITQLIRLGLDANNLEGNIPPSLGNCQQLEGLWLNANTLTGPIPREIASLTSVIHSFNLARNFLTGVLPSEIGNMSKLLELDVSGNRLSGEIPSSIGGCEMLEKLCLGDNSFEGSIASTLSNLKSINAIDLSKNNLSGQIPAYLQNFTYLEYLNLSYNNLEGEVPKEGIFRDESAFSIVGNRKLCGGLESLGLPACQVDVPKRNRVSLVLKIAIPLTVSCLLAAGLYLAFMWRRKARAKSSHRDLLDELFPKVSYAELSQATNAFSSSNLIGQGAHGSVYRGILSDGGITVAVKVLNLMLKGAARSFMAECNALRNIRHRNLLKIITACSSIDFKGNDFKALVFEFMPNGSLEEWLHKDGNSQLSCQNLNLTQRFSIATDIACALEYLHHHCEIPIVHGDLKPCNILLDHEMTAHVGDFGLARVLSNYPNENYSQNPLSSTGSFKGTIGYVAPEYGMGAMPSLQGDIYSFGIMLLEIFTCRRPTDDLFRNEMDLHQYIKMALPEHILEIVEPSILLDSKVHSNNSNNIETKGAKILETLECVAAILKIGVSCSVESPEERMNMKNVVVEMNKIKQKYSDIRKCNRADGRREEVVNEEYA